jgi:hydroxymethylpyrimidine pyrophosphatase-like HAD family hydrolase
MYVPGSNEYIMDPAITREHRGAVRDAGAWLEERFSGSGVSQQPGKAASVSLYHPDTAFLRSIVPEVESEFRRRKWPLRVSMTWLYINCDLAHVSKASGLDRLFAYTRVPAGRAAGIGDTMSDRPIAERVSYFACPSNAVEEIRAMAAYTSPYPEARGVADILARLPA